MLDEMYRSVEGYELIEKVKIDLILVCGDCQTVRHFDDLKCLNVPDKYKKMGDFHKYYSGQEKVPKLTIFVGGNHEASNYLMTLPYGGWVCDNFYYLGYAGVVRYKGLRIAGVSGIYSHHDCNRGRFERLPFNPDSIRSIYHTRRLDIFRLQLLSRNADDKDPLDVFLSHDWPGRIYDYGNKNQLIRFKPHFERDIQRKALGSPLTEPLIKQLKPKKWFAAHLHCKFQAQVKHDTNGRCTEFLSLNKIENRRNFMEVIDLEPNQAQESEHDDDLYHDVEWLTILKKTISLENSSSENVSCPNINDDKGKTYLPTDDEIKQTLELMEKSGGLKIEKNFKMVEPVIYNRTGQLPPSMDMNREKNYKNHLTIKLLERLQFQSSEAPDSRDQKIKQEDDFKVEPDTKSEPGNCTNGQGIKQENDSKSSIKFEPHIDVKPKPFPKVKVEDCKYSSPNNVEFNNNTKIKKRVFPEGQSQVELDDEGCLPVYVDTKGER